MKKLVVFGLVAAMTLSNFAALHQHSGDTPDDRHAWAVHDPNRPLPVKVEPAAKCGGAPSDAIVLFDGTKASFEKNWCDAKGQPSQWKVGDGFFYTVPGWKNGGAIFTRAEFGDCQLHIEFRHDPENIITNQGAQMRGNSGVFLMNNYEVQILDSYGSNPEKLEVPNYADGMAGSVYAENPPLVNPARKTGEWQTYDIVFHQPIWKGKKLLRPGSVTVFFNGVLVQDHWEMEGLTTWRKRRPLEPHKNVGPMMLQDHGCVVQFRNIWYRPIKSRWDNKTHSAMSADKVAVKALRRETAAKLFSNITNPDAGDAKTVAALAEVISYANEGVYLRAFKKALADFRKRTDVSKEDKDLVDCCIEILVRNRVIPAENVGQ